MTDARKRMGALAEDAVAERLLAAGWTIRARNWRCRLGEIDIVAVDGDCLVVVEVRARRAGGRLGTPEESVDHRKARQLMRLGWALVQQAGWEGAWRIDVAAVTIGARGDVASIQHYQSAVEA